MLAGNSLQVHVAAHPAMRVSDVPDGNRPRKKSLIATPATPGPQPCDSDAVVLHTPSARTTRTVALAHVTNQIRFSLEGPAKTIRERQLTMQVPSSCSM